jgi:CHAT domain-containing protein
VLSLPQLLTGPGIDSATQLKVNSQGQVELTSSGTIVPATAGTTISSGTLDTSTGQKGGTISVLGNQVGLLDHAQVNASGDGGGGTVLIGGDYLGQGSVPHADFTYVGQDVKINADGLNNGNGGKVIVWAEQATRAYGKISARGGALGGDGGFIETSGRQFLDVTQGADAGAANGSPGTWLLDPRNVIISNGNTTGGTFNGGIFTPTADDAVINANTISTALSGGTSVTITTGNTGNQAGNIVVDADIIGGYFNTPTLTLEAANSITLNAHISYGDDSSTKPLNVVFQGPGGTRTNDIKITPNGLSNYIGTGNGYFTSLSRTFDSSGANIYTNNLGGGDGGNISIDATSSLIAGFLNAGGAHNGGNINLKTSGGTITLGSLFENSITSSGGNGTSGNINLTGNVLLSNKVILTSSSTSGGLDGNITITGKVNGTGGGVQTLQIDAGTTGNITLGNSVGDGTPIGNLKAQANNVQLNGNIATTNNSTISFNSSVTLNNDATLTTDEINFNGNVSGGGKNLGLQSATVSRDIQIGGTAVLANNLNLTATKLASLQGLGSLTLGRTDGSGNITIDSGGVTFNTPVTIQAGTGRINAQGAIAGIGNASITLKAPTTLNANITTQGKDITLTRDTLLANDVTLASGNGNISLQGTVDGSKNLTLQTNSGNITLQNTLGSSTPLGNLTLNSNGRVNIAADINLGGSFTQTGTGAVFTAGDITTSNQDIRFSGPVTLTGAVELRPGTGAIAFGSSLSAQSHPLTLTANGIDFTGPVTGSSTLVLQPATPGVNIAIASSGNSNPGTLELSATDIAALQPGFSSITIGRSDSSGAITVLNNVTFKDPVTIQAPTGAGSINATGGTITGENQAAITLLANQNLTTSNIRSPGGNITLKSFQGTVSTGNLDTSSHTGGGQINIIARNQILAGILNTSSSIGNGGNILLDPSGNIQVNSINAQGGQRGTGGQVDITTGAFFQALGTFTDQNNVNASISTAGGLGGGGMIIRHDGGARGIPFDVGNATTNGTAGAITTRLSNSILPWRSFLGPYTQDNIQLITQNFLGQPDRTGIAIDLQGETPTRKKVAETTETVPIDTTVPLRDNISQALSHGNLEIASSLLEELRTQEFQNYFGGNLPVNTPGPVSVEYTQKILNDLADKTGKTPAIIYIFAQPEKLELILVPPKGTPILRTISAANRTALMEKVGTFRSEITNPSKRKTTSYLASAVQLYQWLIAPLEASLKAQKIDTLVFSLDPGLRSLPIAALNDGKQFLVEKYSISLIPSINLVDTRYQDVRKSQILAMGASKFAEQNSLPAVPVELSTITQELGAKQFFLNAAFTLSNLKSQRAKEPFGIIHLATHGEFKPGGVSKSYIQLWDNQLRLDQLRLLGWNKPPVELLVLSACRTALGDEEAELGFGGLAVAAGVKSALGSLWYVSDQGTLGLMSAFYQQLKTSTIKADALRQAQIAMLKGQVRIAEGKLRLPGEPGGGVPLPPELVDAGNQRLVHPYYWSAFTMIGSPW